MNTPARTWEDLFNDQPMRRCESCGDLFDEPIYGFAGTRILCAACEYDLQAEAREQRPVLRHPKEGR